MAEDDGEAPAYVSSEDLFSEEEDEYVLEERRAVGSGVELDIDAEYQDVPPEMQLAVDAPVDDVVEDVERLGAVEEVVEVEELETVEEVEEKKPDEPPSNEGDAYTMCGPGGMLLVDAAQDTWPREMSLYVLKSMYDVPLPDHAECLAISALLRMCRLDFEVEEPPNVEYMSPSGRAPFLKCGRQLVSEMEHILRLLSHKGVSLSGDLGEEGLQRQQELWSLAHSSLSAAELRVCWLHRPTRRALTQPRVLAQHPWPLSFIFGRQKRRSALAWLAAQDPDGTAAADLEQELDLDLVYKQVDDVCSKLSTELGASPYFFGAKPTEFDAMLYGHFFLLLTVPVPVGEHTTLSQVIQDYPNLVALVARVDEEVFGRDLNLLLNVE